MFSNNLKIALRNLQKNKLFAAINILGLALGLTIYVFGGLLVDEKTGLVKGADGSTIPGLYAAGRTAVGIASNSYVSGLSVADCVFSGRRAGRHVASVSG